ncbi:hypothetical protein B0H17DRAFT_918136 [Mycena rosella]|uniref:Uncharacterized protein n=1 Tax=Mycena rosella TaxID=1033263 RepID=A0AAD7MA71_MYCRO|nr:hypothetical protein B0H17DRAFT_918136 [Mycena rosella]
MALLPINVQVMIQGLYNTTVEFFALRNSTPPPGQSSDSTHSNLRTLTPVPDPIGRLTRECASLREQLDAADLEPRGSDASHMRRGLENITNQLARSQAEVAKLEERCRMLERALRGTRELLEARETELERVRKAGSVSSLVEETHEEDPGRLSRPGLARVGSGATASTSMLLEEHRAQLRSTETYMTRTDSWSGAQVMQAVHDLNSEIIQLASSATELCTFDTDGPGSPQAMQDTSARLGPSLAGLLSARERNAQDPTLVGLALQSAMATCVARAMSAFALGLPSKSDVILSQVYSHIFLIEPQPTSSRWRSLTHKYVHSLYPGLSAHAAQDLRETICRWTSDILVAACAAQDASSRAWVRETFGEQIERMVKSVAGIAQIYKEEIMSTNFDIILVESGQLFDERIMTDALGVGVGGSHGTVLGTTELGLRRMTRKGEDRTVEQQLLVRPKVILDSVGTAFT